MKKSMGQKSIYRKIEKAQRLVMKKLYKFDDRYEGIDLQAEYELILQKKSLLSRDMRDGIIYAIENPEDFKEKRNIIMGKNKGRTV